MRDARQLRIGTILLCAVLAVGACDGPPPGARQAVQEMVAMDIVVATPPLGLLVAQAEDLGSTSGVSARPTTVTLVYASAASLDDVRDFYRSGFPDYDLHDECCADPGSAYLGGEYADTYVAINISPGAPHYSGHNTPSPGPAPEGADLYVVVSAIRFLDP